MKNRIQTLVSIVALLFVGSLAAQTQYPDAIVKNGNYTVTGNTTLTANQSITLRPNTWIRSGSTFIAKIYVDPTDPILSSSEGHNFVFTREFQSPMTSISGIGTTADVIESITYVDGLGRPKQQIGIRATPNQKDLVTHIAYDAYGRQPKEYLPWVSNQTTGSYISVSESTINSYYRGQYPDDFAGTNNSTANAYAQKTFEPSPLNRVTEQAAPGTDWKIGSGHTIRFDWLTNAINEIPYFRVDFVAGNTAQPQLTQQGFYGEAQLMMTLTKDENWTSGNNHTTKEYTNKQGQVVLKRTYVDNSPVDTHYVYDDFGNLTYVLSPKVTVTDGISQSELAELCYQYKYDHRNRLIEKKIPGKGWEVIVYNKLDQPIITQDANQQTKREWLGTAYDPFGRVAFTGLYTHPTSITRTAVQTLADQANTEQFVSKQDTPITIGGTSVYYTNSALPVAIGEVHTINYYDNYTFDHGLTAPTSVYGQAVTTQTQGLATGSKVRVLGKNDWITTVTYYDAKGRPIYIVSKNEYLDTEDIVATKLDFVGRVLETKTTHVKGTNTAIVTIDKFTYDHMGRLLTQTQEIGDQTETIVSNTYDELGQLTTKSLGGGIQTVDHRYNVRGWLTGINDVNNLGEDVFAFGIHYNKATEGLGASALYNGNISETLWRSKNDNTKRAYGYQYDALNRITTGQDNTSNYSLSSVSYDKNGNIEALVRRGQLNANATTFGIMDQLSYTYDAGNKLRKVTDAGNTSFGFKDGTNTNDDYVYDANGNMTLDRNKGITGITYNHLNLPETVSVQGTTNGSISYIYDATGVKLAKKATEGSSETTTEYAGNYIYKNGALEFMNHPEGYIEPSADAYRYIYQLKDHLGNIRMSFADDNNDGSIATSEIKEEKNYYPFGLQQQYSQNDPRAIVRGRKHEYGFGGNEEQNEVGLGWIDITARNYDPTIARWMNSDPLAEQMRRHSPYNYAFDNPIFFIDPDGMAPQDTNDDRHTDSYGGSLETVRYEHIDYDGVNTNKYAVAKSTNSPQDHIRINTKTKEAEVFSDDNDYDTIETDGEISYSPNGKTEARLKEEGYSIKHTEGVGMGAVDNAVLILAGEAAVAWALKAARAAWAAWALRGTFDTSKTYMNPKLMSTYIRELEIGFKKYGGDKLADDYLLNTNQLNALKENLKQTLTKTIPNASTTKAVQNQLNNPRWRFIDQIPGGRDAINNAIKELDVIFKY